MLKKIFLTLLLILLLLLATVASAYYYLLYTNSGLNFALKHAKPYLPKPLSYASATGQLARHVTFQQIRYDKIILPSLQIQWQLSWRTLFDKSLRARMNSGQTTLTGTINWRHNLQWQGELQAQHLNPQHLLQTYAGDINVALRFQGQQSAGIISHEINIARIQGQLNGKTVNGEGLLQLHNTQLRKVAANFNLANNHLKIKGTVQPTLKINWQIDAPKLAVFAPNLQGELMSHGSLNGSVKNPLVQANIKGKNIHYQDYRLENVRGQITLNPAQPEASVIHLLATSIALGKLKFATAKVKLTGDQTKQQIHINLSSGQQWLKALINGEYRQTHWQGELSKLSLIDHHLLHWQLKQRSQLYLSSQQVSLSSTCVSYKQRSLCLAARWKAKAYRQLSLTALAIPISEFQHFLPHYLSMKMATDLKLQLSATAGHPLHGKVKIEIDKGDVHYLVANQLETLHLQAANLKGTLSPKGFKAKALIHLTTGEKITGYMALPHYIGKGFPTGQEKLTGQLNFAVNHLNVLSLLLSQLHKITGRLQGKFGLDGTLGKPQVHGQLQLINGQATIPQLGLSLKKLQAQAHIQPGGQLSLGASVQSGKGILKLKGHGRLTLPHYEAHLEINGENVLLSHLPIVKLIASPTLKLQIDQDKTILKGRINIPKANIKPTDYKGSHVTQADDIIFTKQGKPIKPTEKYRLYSDIKLHLGQKVHLEYGGLKARLIGHLLIHDQPGSLTTATGRLIAKNGQYKAYGRDLNIDRGELIFNGGPVNNPGLDVQASKKIQTTAQQGNYNLTSMSLNTSSIFLSQTPTIIVGVHLQNNLRNPVISLFSNPSGLSNADILSYLILGRPASRASRADGQTLMAAASALDINGSNIGNFTDSIEKTFGLSELSIESDAQMDQNANIIENTSLVLGKYLTPRLYINYSIGILQPINTFRIRYSLSRRWVVQGSNNVFGTGADVFYSIERN